jgi:hypothetical protein
VVRVTFAGTVPTSVNFVRVVVTAVVPVTTPSDVPVAEFKFNFTRGTIDPVVPVAFIQTLNVIVEPAAIVPEAFGTPLCVSNALIRYSPVALFFRFTV